MNLTQILHRCLKAELLWTLLMLNSPPGQVNMALVCHYFLIVSKIVDQKPGAILTALGAVAAVLRFVFKDTQISATFSGVYASDLSRSN